MVAVEGQADPAAVRGEPLGAPGRGRRLRVLFVNDTSRNGGPGSTLLYILKFLDPSIVHRSVVVPRDGVVASRLRQQGVTEDLWFEPNLIENLVEPWDRAIERGDFEAPRVVRGVRALGNVARAATGMARLAARVRRGRYDVIFCNGTSANFAGAALGTLVGVPVVWHVFYTHVARPLVPLHSRLARTAAVRSILCVSGPTARLFDRSAPGKVRIVHDSIDVHEFAVDGPRALRAELGLRSNVVIFGSQGRIVRRKGYVEMIRAARLALDSLTTDDQERIRFVVIGDTPQDVAVDHLAECRGLVRQLGLEHHFRFLGFRADIQALVRDFDVTVVPSVYEDPLPRATFEAMALAKPVVAFSVGGIVEMVEPCRTGLLAGNPPDVPLMAEHFVTYFRSPGLRMAHGHAGRSVVERRFDARPHAQVIQREIERVAG
jgi:glycosyltransferase involved in cell wall biosynthesis